MTETIPFEILGHFEEIIDQETGKCYGTRPAYFSVNPSEVQDYDLAVMLYGTAELKCYMPEYGYAGRTERTFKMGEYTWIDKAHKGMQPYKFKANAKCWIITHPICGRMKKEIHGNNSIINSRFVVPSWRERIDQATQLVNKIAGEKQQ